MNDRNMSRYIINVVYCHFEEKKNNSVRFAKTLQATLQLQHFYKLIAA